MPTQPRREVACNLCRSKKIRCNGSIPCANCQDRAEKCVVTPRRRPRISSNRDLSRRIQQPETLLQTTSPSLADSTLISSQVGIQGHRPVTADHLFETDPSQQHANISQPPLFCSQQSICSPTTLLQDNGPFPNVSDLPDTDSEESSVYATQTVNHEYYGPRSFVSFCSEPGVKWIDSKVNSGDFKSAATRFTTYVARMLKFSGTLSTSRLSEPPSELAMQYTKVYFEESLEQAFGIVDRPWFESKLRAHFSGAVSDDAAWYALRNVLWASGCRIMLSKTESFKESKKASQALFENAFSAHTELLYMPVSMTGLQAFILMAFYSEGVGKTSLQFMLCSNAMRLACSKGLHRQPAKSWNMSAHEVNDRNWMFWSIYCLEKETSSRAGRPSVMHDEEISCQIPQEASSGRLCDTIYCHALIEMMRISSAAQRRLSSAEALRQTPSQLVETIQDLNKTLEGVKSSLQRKLSLDISLEVPQPPEGITLRQLQSLQNHYFCLVLNINSPLAYPWSDICTYAKQDSAVYAQIEASSDTVAQAARSAILSTRQQRFNASCSALTVFTPVYSFIMLFIHVLKGGATARSDLTLLDVALGYFSHVEFATDLEFSLPFARELCQYARLAVDQQHEDKQKNLINTENTAENPALVPVQAVQGTVLECAPAISENKSEDFSWLAAEDMEMWSTFLPFTSTESHNLLIND